MDHSCHVVDAGRTVRNMSRTISLAVIPGDGIGQEVVAEGLKVLGAVLPSDVKLETRSTISAPTAGTPPARRCRTRTWRRCRGTTRSCSARSATRRCRPACWSAGCCCKLRFAFDHYVNLRPARLFPGDGHTAGGRPRASTSSWSARAPRARTRATAARCATGTPQEVATEVSAQHRVRRRAGGARRVRSVPPARPRKKLTLVHKNNVLVYAGHLWTQDLRPGGRRVPGRSAPTICTWTRRRSSSSRSRSAST